MRSDPTRTTGIQRAFLLDFKKRMRAISAEVQKLIVTQDALGLEPGAPDRAIFRSTIRFQALAGREWEFLTDEQKAKRFQKWLEDQVDQKLLEEKPDGKPWPADYVEKAYRKGAVRAFIDARGPARVREKADFFEGAKQQHLRQLFSNPETLNKVRTLATRTFGEIKGISQKAARDLNRILANGILQGKTPQKIAKEMRKSIEGLSKGQALRIVRTEVVAAHAEAQLDTFEGMGVEEVSRYAEWRTASDPCERCWAMRGQVLTIEEARGVIPLHPHCRCSWVPVQAAPKDRKRKLRRAARRAIRAGADAAGLSF